MSKEDKMKCPHCKKEMTEKKGMMKEDDIEYSFYRCTSCKKDLLDMKQLHEVAEKYRKLKDTEKVTFAKWGNSLAVRISKATANALHISPGEHGRLFREKNTLKIVLSK